jgi:hypothetical protein
LTRLSFGEPHGGGGFRAAKTSWVELLALRGVVPRAAAQGFEGRGHFSVRAARCTRAEFSQRENFHHSEALARLLLRDDEI